MLWIESEDQKEVLCCLVPGLEYADGKGGGCPFPLLGLQHCLFLLRSTTRNPLSVSMDSQM